VKLGSALSVLKDMSQKECKSCGQLLLDNPPFCSSCWEKNLTDEELEESDQVWVVKTKQDLHTYSEKAKNALAYTYVLVEGKELSQQVSKAFNARVKLATKKKIGAVKVVASATGGFLAGIAAQALTRQSGVRPNPSNEFLKNNAPWVVGAVGGGAGMGITSFDGEDEFKALPFASECDSMFRANFRLIRNAGDYVVLRREKTITEDIGAGLNGAANDFKSIAEDVDSVRKKVWNWLK
jgi:hypothetical protein